MDIHPHPIIVSTGNRWFGDELPFRAPTNERIVSGNEPMAESRTYMAVRLSPPDRSDKHSRAGVMNPFVSVAIKWKLIANPKT
jgi:hypothetical protein